MLWHEIYQLAPVLMQIRMYQLPCIQQGKRDINIILKIHIQPQSIHQKHQLTIRAPFVPFLDLVGGES
jgi:hypothetical protein